MADFEIISPRPFYLCQAVEQLLSGLSFALVPAISPMCLPRKLDSEPKYYLNNSSERTLLSRHTFPEGASSIKPMCFADCPIPESVDRYYFEITASIRKIGGLSRIQFGLINIAAESDHDKMHKMMIGSKHENAEWPQRTVAWYLDVSTQNKNFRQMTAVETKTTSNRTHVTGQKTSVDFDLDRTLGCLIDRRQGAISFTHNGEEIGCSFPNEINAIKGPIFPFVSFDGLTCKIKVSSSIQMC